MCRAFADVFLRCFRSLCARVKVSFTEERTMSYAKTLAFKIITRSLLVVGMGVGIVFVPNISIFDEDLLPEITERLSAPVNPDIEGNANYHLYGLASESDKDTYVVGRAVIARLQSKHAKGESAALTEQERLELFGSKDNLDAEWPEIYPAAKCSPRENTGCLEELVRQIQSRSLSNERLLVQLSRYNTIIQQPHMIEDTRLLDYTSPLPAFGPVLYLSRLNQAAAYQKSGLEGLISSSQLDMKFWRMTLAESQTLIGRMITINALRGNLLSLSFAINKLPSLTPAHEKNLRELLKPLSPHETNIDAALTSELRLSVNNRDFYSENVPEGIPPSLKFLIQQTASVNLYYKKTINPGFALGKLSPPEFYERAQAPVNATPISRFNPYNLGGKILQSKSWQLSPYIGRAHDLAGIYSLVAVQLELKTNPPQDVAAAIKTSPYKNPYTQKPFDYDPTNKTLSFQCFDMKDVCRINI